MVDEGGMTPEEREVMDHIVAACNGISKLGLNCNSEQVMVGTHLLQQFIQQRVLKRTYPEFWSSWFDDQGVGPWIDD